MLDDLADKRIDQAGLTQSLELINDATSFEQGETSYAAFARHENRRLISRIEAHLANENKTFTYHCVLFACLLLVYPSFALFPLMGEVTDWDDEAEEEGRLSAIEAVSILMAIFLVTFIFNVCLYVECQTRANVYYTMLTKGIIIDFANRQWYADRTVMWNVVAILSTIVVLWQRIHWLSVLTYFSSILVTLLLMRYILTLEERLLSLNKFIEMCDSGMAFGQMGFRFVHEEHFIRELMRVKLENGEELKKAKSFKRKPNILWDWERFHKLCNRREESGCGCACGTYFWGLSSSFLLLHHNHGSVKPPPPSSEPLKKIKVEEMKTELPQINPSADVNPSSDPSAPPETPPVYTPTASPDPKV